MKSIVITGASSGIGRGVAELFLAQGWRVGLIGRRADALSDVAGDFMLAETLPCDVTDEEAVNAAFDAFGQLDVLFNNAGMFGKKATIDEISLADWQQVVDLNLTGMFLCARAAFRQMRIQEPQGGRIINNGSISAHAPREGSICYTTTKHGVSGLTKTLSLDGRAFDITCGQIDIGNARTDMLRSLAEKHAAEGLGPLHSMDVADVAKAVWYMANLPAEANVQTMTVMASKMPYIGRG